MSTLAKLVRNHKSRPSRSLIRIVDQHLSLRQGDDRRDGLFHPSDLSYRFCPRAWALFNYHPRGLAVKSEGHDPQLKRIFDNGHHFHDRVQRYFQEEGVLWGQYRRLVGWNDLGPEYEYFVGFAPDGPGWEYTEVRLYHEEDHITGHTDGLVNIDGEKWGLEAKSINPHGYQWVENEARPFHRTQTHIYMHCLQWMDRQAEPEDAFDAQPLKGFIILYECKGTQAMREHLVPFDEAEIEETMNGLRPLMEEAWAFRLAHESGEDPKFPRCRCEPGKQDTLCSKLL